jgi:glycosyltransferase involved in cell wall biosynthesis
MTPLVSVVMPARNESRYVGEAVQSVVEQSYGEWELVVVNDGSTDATAEIVRSFADPRIRVYDQPGLGFVGALNRGLALARGDLIARLDADDIAHPKRLESQVEFLANHPGVGLVGSAAQYLFPEGERVLSRRPTGDPALRRALLRDNPFVHSSIMLRRSVLHAIGGYDARYPSDTDYDLWVRVAARFEVANLAEPLVTYRLRMDSLSRNRRLSHALRSRLEIQRRAARMLGPWHVGTMYVLRSLVAVACAEVADAAGLSQGIMRRRLERMRPRSGSRPH